MLLATIALTAFLHTEPPKSPERKPKAPTPNATAPAKRPATKPPASGAPPRPAANIACTLREIREVRSSGPLGTASGEKEDRFTMPSDRPGLRLGLQVDLPKGSRILSLEQPASIVASDSTGRDLTKIEASVLSNREYLTHEPAFFDQPDNRLTLTLTPPERSAQSLSISLRAELLTYGGTQPVQLDLATTLTELPANSLTGKPLRYKVSKEKQGLKIQVEGRGADSVIEKVRLINPDASVDSTSRWTINDASTTFDLDAMPDERAKIEFVFRTGIERRPIVIDWQNLKLP